MQIVWITGASSGIGAALAQAYSQRGVRLVLSARRRERLEAVRAACLNPDWHRIVPLDLADPATLEAAAEQVLAEAGRVDVLVHNGGISQRSLVQDTGMDVVRRIMEVNFFGAVALTRAVLPSMLARRRGQIVVVSSVVGRFGTPQRAAYAASKHALHGFFDALRAEVHDAGLRVTIACPGRVRTDISLHALTGDGSPHGQMDPGQARGMPADECAERIVRAAERGKEEVYIGGTEVLGVYAKRFVPRLFSRLIRSVNVT
ncbi:short chain dehydrogenase [Rhodothermaceae bacterium RA]|nr:short chain dehydrogenase [Rhodothermaceae bacterium RA]